MNRDQFYRMIDSLTEKALPTGQHLTANQKDSIYSLYYRAMDWEDELSKALNQTTVYRSSLNYWYSRGILDLDMCNLYASTYKERDLNIVNCKWCDAPFVKENLKGSERKTCCTKECDIAHKERWSSRLGKSRRLYNQNDPKQYAKRHNVTEDEALQRIREFQYNGSVRREEYWLLQGLTEEEAKAKVSEIQSRCANSMKERWREEGLSEDEVKSKMSEFQRNNAYLMHAKVKENGNRMLAHFDFEYHMNKLGVY